MSSVAIAHPRPPALGDLIAASRGRIAHAVRAVLLVAGAAGLPWFAGGTAGYASASFGYVVGFFFAATGCGYLASRGADRSVLKSVPAMIAAEVIITPRRSRYPGRAALLRSQRLARLGHPGQRRPEADEAG